MDKVEQNRYQNFTVAIYCRVYEVNQMADLDWLREKFEVMSRSIKVGKVYLETHRDMVMADEATINGARRFFEQRGLQVAGGITATVKESQYFKTYCYTNPEHRKKLKEVVEFTARLFDEIILDDFFFTSCKCESCIRAKGDKSWTQFRLGLMEEASRALVIDPARLVNPNVELVIKYPNWYEHFQGLGYHLEAEPKLFDRIYTGTETRDPALSYQHLQPYHGYSIMRYLENVKPGCNGGGWVDPFGMANSDRYAEQLWLTLIAKAREITLFDFRSLQYPLKLIDRATWQGTGTSFDFDEAAQPARLSDGALNPAATIGLVAGHTFDQADRVVGQLGTPLGVKCYKPYHSVGEDFLPSYLGMLGIPIDLVPQFPATAPILLLTESAKFDPQIVEKIKGQLMAGKSVVITSGLLSALQGKGIEDIVELRISHRKALVRSFLSGWNQVHTAEKDILLPQIQYLTNDSWEVVSAMGGVTGYPLFHSAQYANGVLYVLTIPDNYSDLYALPTSVLRPIRETLSQGLDVLLDALAKVCLFLYDNQTLIVESFLDMGTQVNLITSSSIQHLNDALSGESLTSTPVLDWRGQDTGKKSFGFSLPPHSYRVFKWENA